jgi:hypothetical protein
MHNKALWKDLLSFITATTRDFTVGSNDGSVPTKADSITVNQDEKSTSHVRQRSFDQIL